MKNKTIKIALSAFALLILASCGTNKLAAKLDKGDYFTLQETNKKGEYGPVFIFPERHDSRLIQAQTAWGLEDLRERGNINTIALEGMYIGEELDADKLSYRTDAEKYAVLLSLLERGEIKAPEMAYLARDSYVFGIEKEEQYNVTMPDDIDAVLFTYLAVGISIDLEEEIDLEDDEAFETMILQNPWALETYEMLSGGRSILAIIKRMEELEQKVRPVSFLFSSELKTGFKQLKEFFETAHQRSLTMANSVYEALQKKNEALAMIIGLNHTKEVTEYFDKKGVRYYVMDPAGLYGGDIWSDLTDTGFDKKRAVLPVFEYEGISRFFVNEWNTRPVIDRDWFKKENHFVLLIERIIAGLKDFASGGLRVDEETMDRTNPKDIKFKMVNENGRELYLRAVANPQNRQFTSYKKALEDMIDRLAAIDAQNLPLVERAKVLGSVIEAFNLGGYTVFVSPLQDVWSVNLPAL
jgi:hypothetical protein